LHYTLEINWLTVQEKAVRFFGLNQFDKLIINSCVVCLLPQFKLIKSGNLHF